MGGIKDKAKEALEGDEQGRRSESPDRETTANNPEPQQGAGEAEQAPNPMKAAEDVD